jgi:hypothetical protein
VNVSERVAQGVALLDEQVPGWVDRINLDALDVWNVRQCVLGQLFGGYNVGLFKLGLGKVGGAHLGFAASPQAELTVIREYAALNEEWRRVITILRQPQEPIEVSRTEKFLVI